jgi:hypothetical protein
MNELYRAADSNYPTARNIFKTKRRKKIQYVAKRKVNINNNPILANDVVAAIKANYFHCYQL